MKRLIVLLLLICLVVPAITLVTPSVAVATTKQILPGGYLDALSASATEYNALCGGYTWTATENAREQCTSPPGKLRKFKVNLTNSTGSPTSPGTGKSYTFTVMVNGGTTALILTISDAETSDSDITHELDLTAGQTVSIRCVPANTPTAVHAKWSTEFESTNSAESWLMSGVFGGYGATYTSLYGSHTGIYSTVWNSYPSCFPKAGTISKLYCVQVSSTNNSTITLYNGSDSALTCTITAGNTTGNDTSHDLSPAKGDQWSIKHNNDQTGDIYCAMGLTFSTGTDGESVCMGTRYDALSVSAFEYQMPTGGGVAAPAWQSTIAWNDVLRFDVCTLTSVYYSLSARPGAASDKYSLLVYKKDTPSDALKQTVTITDPNMTNEDTTDFVVADGDYVYVGSYPENTPSNTPYGRWGWVMYIAPAGGTCSANISEAQASYDFGTIVESGSKASGLTNFTLTNSSGGAVSVAITATDMIGVGTDWTVKPVPGADEYTIKAGTISAYSIVLSGTPATLFSSIVDSGTKPWGLKLWAPTSFSNGNVKSGTITVTATCL